MEKGKCSYKSKCKYHHPPLCHDSINNKQCFNAECRFFHLKRTLRYRIEDEHLKESLHASNYQTQNQQPQQMYQNQPPPQTAARVVQQPQIYHMQQASTLHHPQPSEQSPSALSRSDMPFLLQTINGIKDALGKEIAELKGNINAQHRPQIATTNSVPQTQTTPLLYNLPNVMLPMQHQTHHQR